VASKKRYSFDEIEWARAKLKLPSYASFEQIKTRYREAAKEAHPDKKSGGAEEFSEEMGEINTAWAILKNYTDNFKYTFDSEAVKRYNPAAFEGGGHDRNDTEG